MIETSDYLGAALHFAKRARCALNDGGRERLFDVAQRYAMLAIAEGRRFIREMPKRPPAPSVRRAINRRAAKS